MYYVKISTGEYPLTEIDIRVAFPNTSFPNPLSDDVAKNFGYEKFEHTSPPKVDKYQKVSANGIEKNNLGIWVTSWLITEMTEQEKLSVDKNKAQEVRLERSRLLTNCDWTQLDDTPLTNDKKLAWATYRQELRDVPAQSGFPWNVIWPTKPE